MKKFLFLVFLYGVTFGGELDKFKIRNEILSKIIVEDTNRSKSPAIAFGLSLIMPGLGEAYIQRFDIGKYFLISEISLWLAYFGLNEYGKWLNEDAINFAVIRAGIEPEGKPEDFFANIENYRSVYDYNLRKGRDRDYSKIYDPTKFYWWWDSEQSRLKYKDMRTKSRAFRYYAKFTIVFIISNHFASAIDALILTKKQNEDSSVKLSLFPLPNGFNLYVGFDF